MNSGDVLGLPVNLEKRKLIAEENVVQLLAGEGRRARARATGGDRTTCHSIPALLSLFPHGGTTPGGLTPLTSSSSVGIFSRERPVLLVNQAMNDHLSD